MSAGDGGEKTEKPTPKRLKESRKEGQVARTQELGGWGSLLVVAMAMPMLLSHELGAVRRIMVTSLSVENPSTAQALTLLGDAARHVFLSIVVLGSAVMLIGVASALAQGGFFLATKTVKPTWSKLDPIKGAKRVFGPHALWEGAKMLLKSTFVALVAYVAIKSVMPLIGGLVPIPVMIEIVSDKALGLIRNIGLVGLAMAAADYLVQRRRIGKQTRMSKDEVKQEHKQTEGDPMVKSAMRSRQLAAARNRMMADVATADVVLVNPTHVAVALRYDAQRGAPRVVARGAGAIAARIRELAAEDTVPLVRDVPLARALYRSTKVGDEIPAELFGAVAQVLAFVISRRSRGQHGGEHRSPRPEGALPPVPVAGRRRRPQPGAGISSTPGRTAR
ncbi:EscU/YscU/HrcU family type III secretion system export apparatus switch protein [Nocardioides marmoriginsengisoli]|uniref:EscU/YscU/HrcU family type III secretion system export apparatus switch protein n=1 Tax=Nocardioides marmoriginsengisoli TaxID=661483 RepID=A0A3N0CH76_9ACTN|nr:EscU/YscU/HrcU family type III secretion system export apparatus switch protein [Nocardioides marmoriginsengisoli]RNL62639.1 EscU/YscU/HrcU family type III secretion system export apparatus switch protein [Nocardioides marmoriginsengisoli]